MSAIWHDSGQPSFLGIGPKFSFYDLPEIHQEAPSPYQAAMEDIKVREGLLGIAWFKRNAVLARKFFEQKRSWWL